MPETISLLGVNVSRVNLESAAQELCDWVRTKKRSYVCVAPVSTLVDANRDESYRKVVNAAGMVTPDGMPVVWLAQAHGCKEVSRTYGPDLMHAVCAKGQALGLKHFFYGGTEAGLEKLTAKLRMAYPKIRVVGTYAPAMRPQGFVEEAYIIDGINQVRPDMIWVGLGSPKQDFWMSLHRPMLHAPVIVGAGAAFDFLSGIKAQAPPLDAAKRLGMVVSPMLGAWTLVEALLDREHAFYRVCNQGLF